MATSWEDRLGPAAYTSPSGTRLEYAYEDVSQQFEKKTTAFQFPSGGGTLVQDKGHTGRRFPLTMYFDGPNHDKQSYAMQQACREYGAGVLEHPAYGKFTVVPFGQVTQRDDLRSAANQSVIQVVFWETIGVTFPSPGADAVTDTLVKVEEFNIAQSEQFANTATLETVQQQSALKGSIQRGIDTVKSTLQQVASATTSVDTQFNAIYNSINGGLDTLIGQPILLALQIERLIQAPARAQAAIQAKLDGYLSLIAGFTGAQGDNPTAAGQTEAENDFLAQALFANAAQSGIVVAAANIEFATAEDAITGEASDVVTRSDAVTTAVTTLESFDAIQTWQEPIYDDLGIIDTGEGYSPLFEATSLVAGYLVQTSFDLNTARVFTLDRPRTIIDLAAELYGNVGDSALNFLIDTNGLTGVEMLEIPRGRKIVAYIS